MVYLQNLNVPLSLQNEWSKLAFCYGGASGPPGFIGGRVDGTLIVKNPHGEGLICRAIWMDMFALRDLQHNTVVFVRVFNVLGNNM